MKLTMSRQANFEFLASDVASVQVDEIAASLSVSDATVRNWIKTGLLERTSNKSVSRSSFETLKADVVGHQKLNKRANKSHALDPEQRSAANITERIQGIYDGYEDGGVGAAYEASLSDAVRNTEGIYYTPDSVVKTLFDNNTISDIASALICDPCCGSGNFLVEALARGAKLENLWGFDTDPIAVEITRARLYRKTGKTAVNIHCADFLNRNLHGSLDRFDVVVTNPPWGKKLPANVKSLYAARFNAGSKLDTAGLFLIVSIRSLRPGGMLTFLLPDAFFNVAAFQTARKELLKAQVTQMMDHGKPFVGLQIGAKSVSIMNSKPEAGHKTLCITMDLRHERAQQSFATNPKQIFNFSISSDAEAALNHLFQQPHITLEGQARWGLGIVTGSNDKFIASNATHGSIAVFKGSDFSANAIKPATCFLDGDLSRYQQVAPLELYKSGEKLIYRFINSNLVFFYDDQQRFFLNSANMLILKDAARVTYAQLHFLLNSRLMNWVFKAVFNTHKVLRSDLEYLPLFIEFFQNRSEYDERELHAFLGVEETDSGTFRLKR